MKDLSKNKSLKINEAADILKVSNKTLRRWEKAGILVPQRTPGGHRRYTLEQIESFKKSKKSDTSSASIKEAEASSSIYWHTPEELHTPNLYKEQAAPTPKPEQKNEELKPTSPSLPHLPPQPQYSPTPEQYAPIIISFPNLKPYLKAAKTLVGVLLITIGLFTSFRLLNTKGRAFVQSISSKLQQPSITRQDLSTNVLAASDRLQNLQFNVNVPANLDSTLTVQEQSTFQGDAQFNQDAIFEGALSSTQDTIEVFSTTPTTINLGPAGSTTNIGGALNVVGNSLTTPGDLVIDPGGGGVSVGTGTAANVDLTGDDFFVSGDLEVLGSSYIPTLIVGSDTVTDITGSGIEVSSGSLQTTLGTSIVSGEIEDGTITEDDLNASNTATNGQVLTYNSSTGGFTWDSTTGGVFTDGGDYVFPTNGEVINLGGITAAAYNAISDSGTADVAATDDDLYIEDVLEVDGELELDGTLDADGAADFAGGLTNSAGELLLSGGNLQLNDSINATFGTGDDLTITHNGTNSVITSATGDLIIDNTLTTGSTIFTLGTDTSATDFIIRNNSEIPLFSTNGAGAVQLGANGLDGQLVLYNELGGTDFTVTLNLSDSQGADITYTLPPNDGDSNQILSTNGTGTLTWIDVSAGAGGLWSRSGTELSPTNTGDSAAVADLTLGLDDTSATLTTQDTNEDLTIDPNGSGDLYFHGSTYQLSDTGDLTLGGRITFENAEYITNETDDILALVGSGGGDDTDLYIDLDGSNPLIYSNTDSIVGFNDSINVTGQSDLEGYASIGNGSALDADETLIVDRDFTATAGNSAYGLHLLGNITENTSGTHTTIAPLAIDAITVTDGAGTEVVTNLASLYIAGAPIAGTTPSNGPYAIFADAGSVRFDGNTVLNTVEYTWPSSDATQANQVLASNSAGVLSWIDADAAANGHWTDGGTIVYLTDQTDDLAVGSTDSDSEFFFDTSASALNLNPFGASAGNTGELRLQELEANGDNYTGFKPPDTLADNVIYTLPSADATSSNQVLASNSSGTLSWIDISAGSGSLWSQNSGVLSPTTGTDDLAIGGTDSTADFFVSDNGKLVFNASTTGTYIDFALETEWTTGDLVNADFGSSTTLTGDAVGFDLNLNTNVTGLADGDLTGVYAQTPALTSSGATTTNYYGFRSGGGALDTTAAEAQATNVNWYGGYIQIPNIDTGESGDTTSAYGLAIFPGTVTNGGGTENEWGILVDASTGDIVGGDAASDDLLLISTTNATKGDIQFHSSSYTVNSTGDFTIGGRVTFENSEFIANESDDLIAITGSGGADDTDLYIDLDGTYPVLYSNTDTIVGIDDDLQFVGAQTISTSTGDLTIDTAGTFDVDDATDFSSSVTWTGAVDIVIDADAATPIDVGADVFASGTLFDVAYDSAETLTGDLTGLSLNLNTNVTGVADGDVSVVSLQTPTLTSSGAVTTNYDGYRISAAGAITQDTAAGTVNWDGIDITMPNITQSTGTVTADGFSAANGTITTGGTASIFHAEASGVGAGTLYGLNIDGITGGAGTETAINIGSGWDTDLDLQSGTTITNTDANDIDIADNSLTLNLDFGETTGSTITYSSASDLTFSSTAAVNLSSSEAANDAITFTTSDAAGGVDIVSSSTTVDAVDLTADSLTTGNALDISVDAITEGKGIALSSTTTLTSGTLLDVTTTSTALTTGELANFDWSPGSSTTATGDLFTINIGTNGTTTGKLFTISDTGSDLFAVSESIITSALPHEFTAAGDLSVAYDIQFTNQTSSSIKTNGPLTIEAGESFESNDLTLKAYNSGDIVFDIPSTGAAVFGGPVTYGSQVTLADNATPDVSGGSWFVTGGTTTITDFDAGSGSLRDGHIIYIEAAHTVTIDCNASANFDCGGADIALGDNDLISFIYDATEGIWSLVSWVDETDTQTGADVAEFYAGPDDLTPGDVVSIDPENNVKVQKSLASDEQRVIGIISTQPGLILDDGYAEGLTVHPVALTGRVPVKISPDSEPIAHGDLIGASPELGKAQKVTSGYIIGRALETWTPESGLESIKVFVNPIHISPQFADNSASTSGELATRITNLENSLSLLSTQFNINQEATDSAETQSNFTDLAIDELTVINDAVLGDTVINGTLNIGTIQISNTDNSINAIGTLKIQDLALGDIEFLNGLITFDTNGNAIFNQVTAQKFNVAGASAGTATLPAGDSTITIETNVVTESSLIFTNPKSPIFYPLSVVDKVPGESFTVEIYDTEQEDVQFDWWIVDKSE